MFDCLHAINQRSFSLIFCSRWADNREIQQFFEQEFEFYTKFAESLASLLVYVTISLFIILNLSNCNIKTSISRLVQGLLLAYCTRFLKLGALLWVSGPDTDFLWTFVEFFFLVTSVSVVRVLTSLDGVRSWNVMIIVHLARYASHNIAQLIGRNITDTFPCV